MKLHFDGEACQVRWLVEKGKNFDSTYEYFWITKSYFLTLLYYVIIEDQYSVCTVCMYGSIEFNLCMLKRASWLLFNSSKGCNKNRVQNYLLRALVEME